MKSYILNILNRQQWFQWYANFRRLNRKHAETLSVHYTHEGHVEESGQKRVVCVFNGNFEAGGLADRLRTCVSVFQVCQQLGIRFQILFSSPFSLADYLQPAQYDWTVSAEDVHMDQSVDVICCEITSDSNYQAHKVHDFLLKHISQSPCKEIHVYGNPSFCYHEQTYARLFKLLFQPTQLVKEHLSVCKANIGGEYIVAQLRFTRLLGDIEDYGEVLPAGEQQVLIESCLSQLRLLTSSHPSQSCVVMSDSMRFLSAVQAEMDEVYVVPGSVVHIDYVTTSQCDAYQKLFTEFFLMLDAQHIYRLVGNGMRRSGLPYSASLLSDTPLTDITFTPT